MKRWTLPLLVLGILALSMLRSPQSLAATVYKFNLTNNTGTNISKLYICPHSSADWSDEDDLLGGKVIQVGGTVEVTYKVKKQANTWDLKFVWDEGSSVEFDGLALANGKSYKVNYDKSNNTVSVEEI